MTNIISASITNAAFLDDKPSTHARKYFGVIGSRQLPTIYKPKIKEAVRQLLDKGYDIASGGAVGADNYVLESLIELDACHRGIIFSAWRCLDQFPIPVKENVKRFIAQGGQVAWGDVPRYADRQMVVAGLLARNLRLVHGTVGLVAFPFGESRGTFFTVQNAHKKGIPVFILTPNPWVRGFIFNSEKEGVKV